MDVELRKVYKTSKSLPKENEWLKGQFSPVFSENQTILQKVINVCNLEGYKYKGEPFYSIEGLSQKEIYTLIDNLKQPRHLESKKTLINYLSDSSSEIHDFFALKAFLFCSYENKPYKFEEILGREKNTSDEDLKNKMSIWMPIGQDYLNTCSIAAKLNSILSVFPTIDELREFAYEKTKWNEMWRIINPQEKAFSSSTKTKAEYKKYIISTTKNFLEKSLTNDYTDVEKIRERVGHISKAYQLLSSINDPNTPCFMIEKQYKDNWSKSAVAKFLYYIPRISINKILGNRFKETPTFKESFRSPKQYILNNNYLPSSKWKEITQTGPFSNHSLLAKTKPNGNILILDPKDRSVMLYRDFDAAKRHYKGKTKIHSLRIDK